MSLFSFIKNHVSIVDEVGRYVRLRPAGTYLKGPCPFHRETDASFTVSPDKKIFYCFGCHASGDVIAFIAKAENVGHIEAARLLVESHHLVVPPELAMQGGKGGQSTDEKASYFALCRRMAQWCTEQLKVSNKAQKYIESRGISLQSCERFGIGYFPSGSKVLEQFTVFCQQENVLAKDLVEYGILFDARGQLRSPFEDRILFPITDAMGRYCGFGGRIFVPHDDRAKYYNSKESPFFVKGSLLFGYVPAKEAMKAKKEVFLVEGYTDCVLLAQHGYDNVVATLGTACTQEHLQMLSRLVDRVYVMYDGDSAGKKAMLRLAHLCWQVNLELYVVTLPSGVDPAAFVVQGGDIAQLCAAARDIFSFFVSASVDDFGRKSLAEKMSIISDVLGVIGSLSDVIKQDLLLQELRARVGVPLPALRSKLRGEGTGYQEVDRSVAESRSGEEEQTEMHIVGMLANLYAQGQEYECADLLYECVSSRVARIIRAGAGEHAGQGDEFDSLLEQLEDDDRQWVMAAATRYSGVVNEQECNRLVEKVVNARWKDEARVLRADIATASAEGKREVVTELLEKFERRKEQLQRKGLIQWLKKHQNN